MKRKNTKKISKETLLPHYDFSGGVRGKYSARLKKTTKVVVLETDVAKLFPDSAAVNKALRAVGKIAAAVTLSHTR